MAKISSVTFHFILKALERSSSISIEDMLTHGDLSKEVFVKQDTQINSEKLSEIFKFCMEKSGDYTLALKIGSSITYHSLGVLGYLMLNANNLKEVVEKFDYYQKLISGFIKFYLTKNEKYYKIAIYINENPMIPVPSYHAEVHLSAILTILNQIIGKTIIPDLTYFTSDSMVDKEEYKKIFGENIILHKSENAIFFETDKLNITVNNSNPIMLEYFEAQANKIIEDMRITSWYAKVKREILKNIGENEISIDFIAEKFNISTRTLQYHLKNENKRFRDALLSVRMQLANHYIKNTKMDFSSIAFFLGYSESSSFFRAYKKYYKNTPKKYLM